MFALELPFRAAHRTGVPETPRQLRAWLRRLGPADARENARRLADLIHGQNQLVLSPQRRLQLLEILRPAVRGPLDALAARVQAQSLPLPERTRQIAQLERELLGALILGYEMISSATGPTPRSSRRALALVAERVLAARGELLLRHIEAEEPLPTAFWRRTYAVYAQAEAAKLVRRRVRDRQWAGSRRPSPTDAFVSALLLALAHPHSLRPGEAARIHRATQQWARLARLTPVSETPADADERGSVFALALDAVAAPCQWRQRVGEARYPERVLDAAAIVHEVEQCYARAMANGRAAGSAPGDDDLIGPTGLKRLLDNWNPRSLAPAPQISASQAAEVAVGLAAVHECLDPSMPIPGAAMRTERARHYMHLPENVLQTIATDDHFPGESSKYPHARAAEETSPAKAHEYKGSDWLVEATDSHGFCLRWQGSGRAGATVGELVAFRTEGDNGPWHLGVVRWLQFIDDSSFAIGCELLSSPPKAIRIRREPANRHRRSAHRGPGEPALLLPTPGTGDDSATVLVPAHQFRTDDILELDADDRILRVQLTAMREQSVYFARFELTPAPARGRTSGIPYGPTRGHYSVG